MGKLQNLSEVKAVIPPKPGAPPLDYNYAPMFIPMDVSSKKEDGVLKVVTRKDFLRQVIKTWRQYHIFKNAAYALGIGGGLLALSGNLVLGGAAIIGAGYCFARFKTENFWISRYKNRWLYEGA